MTRILFVDDDPITRKMLRKIAELAGHEAYTLESGFEALSQVVDIAPDLIVLDMMMPEMDGFSVLTRLQEDGETAHIPVVMLSAGSEMDAAERVLAAGAKAYLIKPISMDMLLEVISEYTDT